MTPPKPMSEQSELEKLIEAIKQKAYEQGFEDAKHWLLSKAQEEAYDQVVSLSVLEQLCGEKK